MACEVHKQKKAFVSGDFNAWFPYACETDKGKKLEQHHKSSLMDAGSHLLEVIAMVLSYKKTTLQKNKAKQIFLKITKVQMSEVSSTVQKSWATASLTQDMKQCCIYT